MRHLFSFPIFESQISFTEEQWEFLNQHTQGIWRVNRHTGLVDVEGSFRLKNKGKYKSFMGIRFGHVTDNFVCTGISLTTLEGAPQSVGMYFDCSNNLLENLKGSPQRVEGDFLCNMNPLISLEGAPQEVANFQCNNGGLISLEGAPQKVFGNFYCVGNHLKTLDGAPPKVGGNFYCTGNNLTTLEGAPRQVGGDFDCHQNPLTTLKGSPLEIKGKFSCDGIQIDSWNLGEIIKAFDKSEPNERMLLSSLVNDQELDAHFKEHPTDLYLLDDHPEIKAGVLKRTGLKDLSLLGRLSSSNMI